MISRITIALAIVCFTCSLTVAEEDAEIRFKGANVFYEFGNIVKLVELAWDTTENMWAQRFGGTFDLEATRGDNLSLYLGAGSIFWHAIPEVATQTNTQVFFGDAILSKAYAQYKIGDPDNPTVVTNFGFFPVKYSNSKNLGEYLFRTGTYPTYILTGTALTTVNTAGAGVLGGQVKHNLNENFTHSLFFTSERESFPLHDFSLTYLGDFTISFLNVGFGLRLNRLIPVRPSRTTPKEDMNTYFEYNGEDYVINEEYYLALRDGALMDGDTVQAQQWTATWNLVDSLTTLWDTNAVGKPAMDHYTFKGINPLFYAALDFRQLLGGDLFGSNDMLLYGEAVLMGLQNKPVFYEDRMDRLAVTLGFNVPTFGLLDVLNVEVERFTSKYVNGYRKAREGKLPLPDYDYNLIDGYDPDDWTDDDLRWSVFFSREIVKGLSFQGQIANDHLRGRRGSRVYSEQSILVESDYWYYMFKLDARI